MPLVDLQKPVRTLCLYGSGTLILGAAFAVYGTVFSDAVGAVLGIVVGVGALVVGGWFFFGAWYFATGRASLSDIDPQNVRPTTFHRLFTRR